MKPKSKQDQNDGIANPGFNVDVISSDKLRDDLQAQTNYRENASPVVQNRQAAIELQQSKPNFDDPEAGHRVTYLELRPSSIEVHHYTIIHTCVDWILDYCLYFYWYLDTRTTSWPEKWLI